MSEIKEIQQALLKFRDDRDWKQFHDPKNLAIAISIEAAELNEIFLWKTIKESFEANPNKIKEELADVFTFCFLLAEQQGLDVKQIIMDKIALNNEKYPVEKAKGTAKKYTDL